MKRIIAILGSVLCGTLASPMHAQDSLQVGRVQDMLTSTLESGAPEIAFVQWLARLGGKTSADVTWETNDCGEGGDGRPAPTCVEGQVTLGGDTRASVSVAVADTEGRAVGKPSLFMMYLKSGQKVTFAKSLKDLEATVSQWRK